MRLFRREPAPPASFWTWWSGAQDRLAQAISAGSIDAGLIDEIGRAVRGIHPEVAWELAPGKGAEHAFCISAEGRADLRQVALRWLESAPPADATWEYHASRQAGQRPMSLDIGGARFDLAEMRAIGSWDPTTRRLDVSLWHPQFEQVPSQVRPQVGFLFLDNLLGEEDVERWIGRVDILDAHTAGRTPDEIRAEIERHKAEHAGDETWVLGQLDGERLRHRHDGRERDGEGARVHPGQASVSAGRFHYSKALAAAGVTILGGSSNANGAVTT
jgi:hypothetical protein